VISKRHN